MPSNHHHHLAIVSLFMAKKLLQGREYLSVTVLSSVMNHQSSKSFLILMTFNAEWWSTLVSDHPSFRWTDGLSLLQFYSCETRTPV